MKTLKKNDTIMRLKDSSNSEIKIINEYISNGWKFISKKEWKDSKPKKESKKPKKSKK